MLKVFLTFECRLELYGVVEHKVQGDGNCQVRIFRFYLFLLVIMLACVCNYHLDQSVVFLSVDLEADPH